MDQSKRILVIGAAGMLGSEVLVQLRARQGNVYAADAAVQQTHLLPIDITDEKSIQQVFNDIKPQVVINCAAFTNVDAAEANEDLATAINGHGAGNLATHCRRLGGYLIHISTDYVFDGRANQPYRPNDGVAPQSAYGRSKLLGETFVQSKADQYSIIRTSWLFGPRGNHFIKTILNLASQKKNLKVVDDQVGCPTYTRDLAHCLTDFSQKKPQGLFHFCNGPACSWFDFATEAVRQSGLDCAVEPCVSEEFPRPAPRPKYSVLETSHTLEALGWKPAAWPEALRDYLSSPPVEIDK